MQVSNNKQITEYEKILRKLAGCFISLSLEYVDLTKNHTSDKKQLLKFSVIKILQQNMFLLHYASPSCINKFASNLADYRSAELPQQAGEIINQLDTLLEGLSTSPKEGKTKLEHAQIEVLEEIANNLVGKCSELFINKRQLQEFINNIQASAIALNLYNLSREEQKLSFDQLLFLHELWQIDFASTMNIESVLILFHQSILSVLYKETPVNHKEVISIIVNFLIDTNNVLTELSNIKLILLYNKLQALCTTFEIAERIVTKIHIESRYRNHDRLNNSSYDLLKLFENYNTILGQIENTEFSIAERFLLQRNKFLHEVLINITKYTDLFRMLNITENVDLRYILTEIRKKLTQDVQNGQTIALMISSIESKFSTNVPTKLAKRFVVLDHFATSELVKRFSKLFSNIVLLLKQDLQYAEFIQNAIIHKIAAEYVIQKGLEAELNLRALERDRLYIIKQLQDINFIELFSNKYSNKISNLHFKKYISEDRIKTSEEYIALIIQTLLTHLTVEQLSVLSKDVTDGNCTAIQKIVIPELNTQIKKRTTISKMLYYIFTRQKKELTMLNHIKHSLQQLQ